MFTIYSWEEKIGEPKYDSGMAPKERTGKILQYIVGQACFSTLDLTKNRLVCGNKINMHSCEEHNIIHTHVESFTHTLCDNIIEL